MDGQKREEGIEREDRVPHLTLFSLTAAGVIANVQQFLKNLRTALVTSVKDTHYFQVQVWECDPSSLKFCTLSSEKSFSSLYQVEETTGVLHVYVSRSLPNLLESILYCKEERL